MKPRDRIREVREMRAGDLVPHPENFRLHPEGQRDALAGLLDEVGNVDVLKAVETSRGVMLVDGHLRHGILDPEATIRVAILDLSEEEARKVLATYDRVGALATHHREAVHALLESISFEDARVASMLEGWAESYAPPVDPAQEWKGMPEFEHDDLESKQRIVVHFRTHDDATAFGEAIGQAVTEKTKSLWYPEAEIDRYADKEYADVDGEEPMEERTKGEG